MKQHLTPWQAILFAVPVIVIAGMASGQSSMIDYNESLREGSTGAIVGSPSAVGASKQIFTNDIREYTAAGVRVCPPEKPIKRVLREYPRTVTCTTLACAPKLVCGPDGTDWCVHTPTNDCNRCTPDARDVEICLSQEELDRAK